MNKKQAARFGKLRALEVVKHGDFTRKELEDSDLFTGACTEAMINGRQYAGDISYTFAHHFNADNLFDAYDDAFYKEIARQYAKFEPLLPENRT